MQRVLILLSTYNGAEYINDQLESLFKQTDVEIYLLVRDDGSKDDTISILNSFKQRYGSMFILSEENIGAANSFYRLIEYAATSLPKFDYYAFCDQDDVWLNDKLSSAISFLETSLNEKVLYFCASYITDSNLNIIETQEFSDNLSLPYCLFRQPAIGCTQVLSNAFFFQVYDVLSRYRSKYKLVKLHDTFIIQLSQLYKIEVLYDNKPHILYRRHGNNVTTHHQENILKKVRRVYSRINKNKNVNYCHWMNFKSLLYTSVPHESQVVMDKITSYKDSMFKTLYFALFIQKYFKKFSIKMLVIYTILLRRF